MKHVFRLITAAMCALTIAAPAEAQSQTRPIRIVLGFAAGGGSDTITRIIAQRMTQQLGQPVIVENKPGADGIIAADAVAKSAPDGHTLYFASNTALVAVPILRGPTAIPYDPFRDFTPVTLLGRFTLFLVASPGVPATTVREFVDHVRAHPGKLNYASSHSVARLASLQFLDQGKLDMVHVPYKGDAPALTDLMMDRVHMLFGTGAAVSGFVKDGKMKALITLRETRSPMLPDVPTAAEAGMKITVAPWAGLYGPAGMPPAVTERINLALKKAMADKEVRDRLEQLGFEASISTPAEMAAIHRDEYEVFRKAVHDDGIKFD